jgi:hypothetical protein
MSSLAEPDVDVKDNQYEELAARASASLASCKRRTAALLGDLVEGSCSGEFDLELPESSCDTGVGEALENAVVQSVRLCNLRLQKVQKQWSAIASSVMVEDDWLQQCEEEYASDLVDDVIHLCENIGDLMQSDHAEGIWSNGHAVIEHYMATFGNREGEQAVHDFLCTLHIDPTNERKSALSLALCMVMNNKIEKYKHMCNGL